MNIIYNDKIEIKITMRENFMGKNIAFITDVHGNAVALQAVLQEIDKREDIERIYCLGDMIELAIKQTRF